MREPGAEGAVPIVLTGTIVPNAVKTQHTDWKVRRAEYLAAIEHYRRFAPVYFLENSSYDVEADEAFARDAGLTVIKYPVSDAWTQGKGYQEFSMLDAFVRAQSAAPSRRSLLKITGRYRFGNFPRLYRAVLDHANELEFMIDLKRTSRLARTEIFCFRVDAYLEHLAGCYTDMNDSEGRYAEHVVFERLEKTGSFGFFPQTPRLQVRSGSTGLMMGQEPLWKTAVRDAQRMILSAAGCSMLWV